MIGHNSICWNLTVWVICQNERPFDYRFSRAAAFQRAAELREGVPSGKWSVEEAGAQLSLVPAAKPCRRAVFSRMEAYATRFESAGKPQHSEVIRSWITLLSKPQEGGEG